MGIGSILTRACEEEESKMVPRCGFRANEDEVPISRDGEEV